MAHIVFEHISPDEEADIIPEDRGSSVEEIARQFNHDR